MLDLTISNTQKINVTLTPKDKDGNVVVPKTPSSWAVTAGIATLAVATDGLSAFLISSDTVGDSQITVTDTTPGNTFSDTIVLHVDLTPPPIPGPIVSFGFKADAPVPK